MHACVWLSYLTSTIDHANPAATMLTYFLKQLCNNLANIINAIGVSGCWASVSRYLQSCHPRDPCNTLINQQTIAIGASLAWMAYVIQNIKPSEMTYVGSHAITKTWGFLIDIIGTYNFYLSWLLEVQAEIYGKKYDMDLLSESTTALALSLYLAILSNVKVRRFLKRFWHGEVDRGRQEAKWDGVFEFMHGYANGLGLFFISANVYNELEDTDQATAPTWSIVSRHMAGLMYGIFSGYMGYHYGPKLSLGSLFSDDLAATLFNSLSQFFNELVPVLSFSLLMGAELAKSASTDKIIYSVIFNLLFFVVFIHTAWAVHQKNLTRTMPDQQAPLLDTPPDSGTPATLPVEALSITVSATGQVCHSPVSPIALSPDLRAPLEI